MSPSRALDRKETLARNYLGTGLSVALGVALGAIMVYSVRRTRRIVMKMRGKICWYWTTGLLDTPT
ncbi:hypothetical protein N7516_009425 [Penicillium verrucosum]|uniref:uncharacterized protein n=1 Tax=Penicillium verrucosum TaxID=60171 RepID=UPI0025454356|nr:uncharacterized protein N7516_009425 [Penicillium verrucosum]KAJ5927652.1 hypothetical protein N7516_009425 [Penicillium verrucosum]